MGHDDAGSCVPTVPLFAGLSADEQAGVAQLARPARVRRGETIYAAGDDVSQLMVVHRGRVRISHLAASGREQLLRVLEPGDFVGEGAFISGARPDHFAVALEDAQMCVFRHRDLGGLIERHPSIGLHLLQGVAARLAETERMVATLTSGEVESRLAAYLLELPTSEHGTKVRLPLAKKDIASLLGTTPETLSRRLAQLADQAMIRLDGPRDIALMDIPALLQLAEG